MHEPMGVGDAMSADSVALASLWAVPTSPPCEEGCSDVENCGEMDVVT
jgi:hypothetical protein